MIEHAGRARTWWSRAKFCSLNILGAACCAELAASAAAERASTGLPAFDFTQPADAQGWQATNDISGLRSTSEGLSVRIGGPDPYLIGPLRNYPSGMLLWLHLRWKSDQGGTGQVFYFNDAASESNSVRFQVPAGVWHDAQAPIPSLGTGYRLRIDPPGNGGTCLLQRMWFEERVLYPPPAWPRPQPPTVGPDAAVLESGELKLTHGRGAVGDFTVRVGGCLMAVGNTRAQIGYVQDNQPRWVDLSSTGADSIRLTGGGSGLTVNAEWQDPDGAGWTIEQRFAPTAPDTIEVETAVSVDRDRSVLYLPLFTLLPGVGSFGTNKTQALLAGVEYLENEPSSSEADVTGPGAWRQVPDTVKITFPVMAIQAEGRYVGLVWEPEPDICALFDSPDRQFKAGGHLLGLLFPGSNGFNREERSLVPYRPQSMTAKRPVRLRATLIGGLGGSVVPAIEHYLRLRGLPAVPDPGYTEKGYYRLAAHGWLDSRIREGNLYRHAYWPSFNAQPSSDAAMWMLWLSRVTDDPALAGRLVNAAGGAIAQVAPQNYAAAQVGHIRYPLPALVFGSVAENAAQAGNRGHSLLSRFQSDGSLLYQPGAGGVDYGRTHSSKEANGYTATLVLRVLEDAVFSGDRSLMSDGLRLLRAMNKFRNTVPRGAQTWEVPLHTPDILASGYLVRAYTLGYELTADRAFLEEARYWAWTGVPFVYLTPPTPNEVGLYGTIPVLGATGWVAPLWIGLPVQWCGLVYGEALYRLARYDRAGPWKQLADGIAAAGIQQTWPLADVSRQGLLPDSFQLRSQYRDGPAINPATVLALAAQYYGQAAPYDYRPFLRHGLIVHAPGTIEDVLEGKDGIAFTVRTWSSQPSWLLINGVRAKPGVKINGREIQLDSPHGYQPAEGRLILQIEKSPRVEVNSRAIAALDAQLKSGREAVEVAWPAAASNFVLEASMELANPDAWMPSQVPVEQREGRFMVTRALSHRHEYFRLRSYESTRVNAPASGTTDFLQMHRR
jgi:hypothetical protein